MNLQKQWYTTLLGRRYPQENLLTAIEQALKYGALDHSAVENIVRQFDKNQPVFNEKEWKGALKSMDIRSWEFDITPYVELCVEVS